jgi:hypothetical protein
VTKPKFWAKWIKRPTPGVPGEPAWPNAQALMMEVNGVYARVIYVGRDVVKFRLSPQGGTFELEEVAGNERVCFNGILLSPQRPGDVAVATVAEIQANMAQWGWMITDPFSIKAKGKYMGSGAKPARVREVTIKRRISGQD